MPAQRPARRLRILILNWRDRMHPRAGGAEVLTHEQSRRLVQRGHEVWLLAGAAEGCSSEEIVDGVHVVRRGGPVTTRFHAYRWYRQRLREGVRFDVVVEEINTLPYFAYRYASAPVVLWIHQLAREVWWYEAPKALAAVGYVLEPRYLRRYRKCSALALSNSTRCDLLSLGFVPDLVRVIPPAISFPVPEDASPKEQGLLVYVGRITPSKRVDHLITALAHVRSRGLDARLQIVGRGEQRREENLREHARSLGVERYVAFAGYLRELEKRDLLARASLIVMASAREGWALVVTEANAVGTPAVVYDRPGLRDSTVHERTGLVTSPTPRALADGVTRLLSEPRLYEQLQSGALEWARSFTWERASSDFESALLDAAAVPRAT
jgi:glycosyltransferase involved in cell wall biosynthesis